MATRDAVTVPQDAEAAVLVGHEEMREGVLAAVGGEVVILAFTSEGAGILANTVRRMRGRPAGRSGEQMAPAEFVRTLPGRLRFYSWAREVQPGETIEQEGAD